MVGGVAPATSGAPANPSQTHNPGTNNPQGTEQVPRGRAATTDHGTSANNSQPNQNDAQPATTHETDTQPTKLTHNPTKHVGNTTELTPE
jgi:hypothetical protein